MNVHIDQLSAEIKGQASARNGTKFPQVHKLNFLSFSNGMSFWRTKVSKMFMSV